MTKHFGTNQLNILEKLAIYQSAWVILVKLGEINMIPLIILSKTLKVLSHNDY
jgi:hypothetical protein